MMSAASSGARTPFSWSSMKSRVFIVSGRMRAGSLALRVIWMYTDNMKPCFMSYTISIFGSYPSHFCTSLSTHVTFWLAVSLSALPSSAITGLRARYSSSACRSMGLLTLMRYVIVPAVLSFRLRMSLNTPRPTTNHVAIEIRNHTSGLFMNGPTMYSRAHDVCTTLHSPVSRSSRSNASDPAKITCMTSSDVLCRSLFLSCCSMSAVLPRISSWSRKLWVSATVSVMFRSPSTSFLAPSRIFCISSTRISRSSSMWLICRMAYSRWPASVAGSAYMLLSCFRLSSR
mmetsp:Transcript_23199/g.72475  ORF Transcript_23199/g.72475 Transcript_23199/m.72475 type:complete len:287 (-) Transcript_23199:1869-2729(-)